MDYQLEAYNTMTFQAQMSSLQGIRVATVYPELTSRKVCLCVYGSDASNGMLKVDARAVGGA